MQDMDRKLCQAFIAATPTIVYQVPAGVISTKVFLQYLFNTDSVSRIVHLYQDGTAAVNEIPSPGTLLAGGSGSNTDPIVVESGGKLYASCDSANKVSIALYGTEKRQ